MAKSKIQPKKIITLCLIFISFVNKNEAKNENSTFVVLKSKLGITQMYDYAARAIAYKDFILKKCYIERMQGQAFWENSRTLQISTKPLTRHEIELLGGSRIASFCFGWLTLLLQQPSDVISRTDGVARNKRSNSHYFVGRIRGQTQSQYLNFGNGNNQTPGKAEAEINNDGSRAIVSGSNGMGQAQSQSNPFSCADCFGQTPEMYDFQKQVASHDKVPGQLYQQTGTPSQTGQGIIGAPGTQISGGGQIGGGQIGGGRGAGIPIGPVDRTQDRRPDTPGQYPGRTQIGVGDQRLDQGVGAGRPGGDQYPGRTLPGGDSRRDQTTDGRFQPGLPGQFSEGGGRDQTPGRYHTQIQDGTGRGHDGTTLLQPGYQGVDDRTKIPGQFEQEPTGVGAQGQQYPTHGVGQQYPHPSGGITTGSQQYPSGLSGVQYPQGPPTGTIQSGGQTDYRPSQYFPGQEGGPGYIQAYYPSRDQSSQQRPGSQFPQQIPGSQTPGQIYGQYMPGQLTPGQLQVPGGGQVAQGPGTQILQQIPGQQMPGQLTPGQLQGSGAGQGGPQVPAQFFQQIPGQQMPEQLTPGQLQVPGRDEISQIAQGPGQITQQIPGQITQQTPYGQRPSGVSDQKLSQQGPGGSGTFSGKVTGGYQSHLGHTGEFSGTFSGNYNAHSRLSGETVAPGQYQQKYPVGPGRPGTDGQYLTGGVEQGQFPGQAYLPGSQIGAGTGTQFGSGTQILKPGSQISGAPGIQIYPTRIPTGPATQFAPGIQTGQSYSPETQTGQGYLPGRQTGQIYLPGTQTGQGYLPGTQTGQGYLPGIQNGQALFPGTQTGQTFLPGAQIPGRETGQGYLPETPSSQGYLPDGQIPGRGYLPGTQTTGLPAGQSYLPGTESGRIPTGPGVSYYPGAQVGSDGRQFITGGPGVTSGGYPIYQNGGLSGTSGQAPGTTTQTGYTPERAPHVQITAGTIQPGGYVSGGPPSTQTGGGVQPGGYVSGGAPGAQTGTGVLQPGGYVSGGAPGQQPGTGILQPSGYVSGGGPGAQTGTGVLQPGGYVPGGAPGQQTGTGILQPGGYVSGGGPGAQTGTGVLQPSGYVPGGAPGQQTGTGILQPGGYVSGGGPGTQTGTGVLQPGGFVSGGAPGIQTGTGVLQPGGFISGGAPGTQTGTGAFQPGGFIPGSPQGGAYIPGQPPGTLQPSDVPGALQKPQYVPGQGYPGGVQTTSGQAPGAPDDANSQAQSSIQQISNGTEASASSQGKFMGGTAQSQVTGTYSGSGSFSASAGTNDGLRGAQTEVMGGKEGAISSAQGLGGKGQSQAQVQLSSETGDTTSSAQSGGVNHGTNTQVQAGGKGGMADAQANGPGSTSSQANIGFKPYDENQEENQDGPFGGGGSASAQSGTNAGQSQVLIQGKYKYGIKYTGGAQASSASNPGDLQRANFPTMKPFQLGKADEIIDSHKLQRSTPPEVSTKDSKVVKIVTTSTTAIPEDNNDSEYDEYEEEETEKPKDLVEQQKRAQRYGASLDPLEDLENKGPKKVPLLKQGDVLQPGQIVPGTLGYQIPAGFRGKVSAGESMSITPNTRRIVYKNPVYAVGAKTNSKPGDIGYGSGYSYQPVQAGFKSGKTYPKFVSVTKSETGSKNVQTGKKIPSVYYTQSSSCGYFTNTCFYSNGQKICMPRPKTNPDGSPIIC